MTYPVCGTCTRWYAYYLVCQEAHERVINLPEDDPDIFEMLLSCLYKGNYVDEIYQNSSRPSEIALLPIQDVIYYLSQKGCIVPDAKNRWDMQCDLRDSFHNEGGGQDTGDHVNNDRRNNYPDYVYVEEPLSDPSDTETASSEASSAEDATRLLELETTRVQIEQRFQGLSNALHLYIMANKYDVSAARFLACERFWDLGRKLILETNDSDGDVGHFSDDVYTQFADIVDELYGHTNPNDTSIRPAAYTLAGSKWFDLDFYAKISPVVRKHEDFARDMAEYMSDVPGVVV